MKGPRGHGRGRAGPGEGATLCPLARSMLGRRGFGTSSPTCEFRRAPSTRRCVSGRARVTSDARAEEEPGSFVGPGGVSREPGGADLLRPWPGLRPAEWTRHRREAPQGRPRRRRRPRPGPGPRAGRRGPGAGGGGAGGAGGGVVVAVGAAGK